MCLIPDTERNHVAMSEQQISTAVAVRPENRRWVSDPVPAITEAAATGETAAIFADIRQVLGVDVVNLIWRHLATIDGALPWAWGTLRPLYADGSVISEATALHKDAGAAADARDPSGGLRGTGPACGRHGGHPGRPGRL